MHFTKKGLVALGYPKHDIRLLQSRQRGASGATTGFDYQRSFAVLRVLELAAGRMDGRVSMDALCPVDDVVVESGGHHEHSQVKVSAAATWGSDRGKLRNEFLAQDDLMQKAGIRRYTLQIVTPHAHRVRHFRLLAPATLKRVLSVRRFPRPTAAEHRPWTVPDAARALDALLFAPLGGVSQREQLWMAVNHACRTPWRCVRVQTAVRGAGRLVPTLPVRDPARKPAASKKVIAAALEVLNAIPRLDAWIVDGICLIECAGVGRRFVARIDDDGFARFLRRILLKRPASYSAVFAVLP